MACAYPPELSEAELLAYLDSEADNQVTAHVEQCPHCRQRGQRLADLQGRLTAALYRVTCPSPLELGEYHLGVLPRERMAAVSRHLEGCPHCSREVAQLQAYLGELAADLEFSPRERIKVWVAELIRGEGGRDRPPALVLAPAAMGLRGEERGPRLYQAGEAQIAIEIQDDVQQPGRKTVLALVTGVATHSLVGHLWQAGQRVAEVPVDELGNLIIAGLVPASYDLILSGPGTEIHIQGLEVGES